MRHVLIIDDEPGIRIALRRYFERQQWSVTDAADGVTALAHLLATDGAPPPDLIICDLNLPGLTGEQIVAQLAAVSPALVARVILTTGDDIEGAPEGSILATHPFVLQKPFDLTTLTRHVATISAP